MSWDTVRGVEGQLALEARTAAAGVGQGHVAAMRADDRADDREPQPRAAAVAAAAGISAVERLENPLQLVHLQSGTVVGHRHPADAVHSRDGDLNRGLRWSVDNRVADQVAEHLPEPGVVTVDDDLGRRG